MARWALDLPGPWRLGGWGASSCTHAIVGDPDMADDSRQIVVCRHYVCREPSITAAKKVTICVRSRISGGADGS
jgi:hypothetical protein